MFGLVEGRQYGWWTPKVHLTIAGAGWPQNAPVSAPLVTIVAGLVLLALFVAWENHRVRAATGKQNQEQEQADATQPSDQ